MRQSYTLLKQSYTQSYIRKHLYLLVISPNGVGNVGFFTKLFFGGGEEEECRNVP